MFQIGDLIIYGTTGVCRVEDITRPDLRGVDRDKLFYCLNPLHQDGIIYSPVENPKVPMRPIISGDEAQRLIDWIPSARAESAHGKTLQQLAQYYQAVIQTNDCRDLVKLTMSIYQKKRLAEEQKHRLGMVDERYMKQAERLLFGELSAALGIPYEDVSTYIADRVEKSACQAN